MLLNYTIIAVRNLRKNGTFSFINIFGLATGLAVALLIAQYVRFELSYECENPLADRVVRLSMDYMNGGTIDAQDAETYPPIAARALREMKEVESYARAYPSLPCPPKIHSTSFRTDFVSYLLNAKAS